MFGFAPRAAQKTKMQGSASHPFSSGAWLSAAPLSPTPWFKVTLTCTFSHFRTPLERRFSNLWSSSENHSSIFETLEGDFRHHTNSICSWNFIYQATCGTHSSASELSWDLILELPKGCPELSRRRRVLCIITIFIWIPLSLSCSHCDNAAVSDCLQLV